MGVPAMTREEAEAAANRLRMLYAEVGYSGDAVSVWGVADDWHFGSDARVPLSVRWTAALLLNASYNLACWPCAEKHGKVQKANRSNLGCEHDPWLSERPRLERVR